ncbi:MAG: hypothetical protein ACRDUV_10130 [Pseudonocardiaceae bacterium]
MRGWLRGDGHDVFLDDDRHDGIEGGDPWKERLHERLKWTDAVLCLVTEDYVVLLGVAHEAFPTAWPPLAQAISAAGAAPRMRPSTPPLPLASVRCDDAARWPAGEWSLVPLRAFLHASIHHHHQQRRRRLSFTAVAAASLSPSPLPPSPSSNARSPKIRKSLATVRGLVVQAETRRGSDLRLAPQLGLAAHRVLPTVQTGTLQNRGEWTYTAFLLVSGGGSGGIRTPGWLPTARFQVAGESCAGVCLRLSTCDV